MSVSRHSTETNLRAAAKGGTRRGPIRIVVAERQTLFRAALRNVIGSESDLELAGETGDHREVLELVGGLKPNVLLLDLQMARLNAPALLEKLQSSPSKIIILADSESQGLARAREAGVSAVVMREAPTEDLISAIRRISGEIAAPLAMEANAQEPLSKREQEIALLVAEGLKNSQIAAKLFIGAPTVKNHLHNIFRKLAISNRLELALYARDKLSAGPQLIRNTDRRQAEQAGGSGERATVRDRWSVRRN